MRVQLNNIHGHVGNCTLLVTHGNVGRASCLRADVQRLNVTNTYGVRPQLMHSRQPEPLARNVGGRSQRNPKHLKAQSKRHRALAQAALRVRGIERQTHGW